jgi:hypothetical protein
MGQADPGRTRRVSGVHGTASPRSLEKVPRLSIHCSRSRLPCRSRLGGAIGSNFQYLWIRIF